MTRARRETAGDVALLAAGALLLVSLFLTWSHQLPASLIARYGATGTFTGVPRDPDAWQVYSAADVVLMLLAVAFVAVAVRGNRAARWTVAGAGLIMLAFVIHAELTPPTNGATVFEAAAGRYAPIGASPGAGEPLALLALGLGALGLVLSFSADR